MVKNRILLFIFFLAGTHAIAQTNRYIVFFTDKANNDYSLDLPEEFLSARSLERRVVQEIELTALDLPVSTTYVSGLQQLDLDVYYPSKWFNAVVVQCDESRIGEIEALSYVDHLILAAPGSRLPVTGKTTTNYHVNAQNDFQLALHGIDVLHQAGLRGEGMRIAVMDGGFPGIDTLSAFEHLFDHNQLLLTRNFVTGGENVYTSIGHGTNVLSIIGGLLPDYEGIAPEAEYLLFLTEDDDSEYRIEEYNWAVAAEIADSAGVDVINTSLGYSTFDDSSMSYSYADLDGQTTLISQAASYAADRGMMIVVSAGNEGNNSWKYITAPADVAQVLSVGAIDQTGDPAGFSSFGPTFDGRVKPEVVSLGVQTSLVRTDGEISSGNGTSFSAPVITGFATLLWQQFPTYSSVQLKQYIISLTTNTNMLDNQRGYGIPEIQQLPTSIRNGSVVEGVNIYPVPARESLVIDWTPENPLEHMKIYSMEGRLLLDHSDVTGQQVRIDVHNYAHRTIILRLFTKSQVLTRIIPLE